MTEPRSIALLALALGALAAGLYYAAASWRVRRAVRSVAPLRGSIGAPAPEGGWPRVCVVVPAHNEEDVVGVLARSLRAQDYPALRVVLALDRCTDGTERAAREAIGADERFEIVTIDACPDEWAGKTHAAWSGLTRSRAGAGAELLLFTDADTAFDPACVRVCVARLLADNCAMLSLLSTLTHDRWFERIVQPAASLELMRQNPLDRVNRQPGQRPFANGQFMLFRRDAYERVGGHEAVRGALLEDLAFARALAMRGLPFLVLPADGLLRCRMYRSWAQFRRGWKRIFTEAARRRPRRLSHAGLKLLGSAVAAPTTAAASVVAGAVGLPAWQAWLALACGAFGLLWWGLTLGRVWRVQRTSLLWLPLAPVGGLLTAGLLLNAASDLRRSRGITWAGRTYDAQAQT